MLSEAMRFYADPDTATRARGAARWGESVECLHCHSRERHFYISTRRIWKCRSCRKQFSPRPARSSRIRRSVLTVAHCHPDGGQRRTAGRLVQAEQRVGSYKLHRLLEVTQTTAQFLLRSIDRKSVV